MTTNVVPELIKLEKSPKGKTRVMFCGTYITQYNGYSKVVFELIHELAKYDNLHIVLYGFQNFYTDGKYKQHMSTRQLPNNVVQFDANKYEYLNVDTTKMKTPQQGFGEPLIEDVIKLVTPDILIIYNDMAVITRLYKHFHNKHPFPMKIVPYLDIVYENSRLDLLLDIDKKSDAIIYFSETWKDVSWQMTKPAYILEHGFNPGNYYPMVKKIARKYYEIPEDAFIISNFNRNQPRKKWDICIRGFIDFLVKYKILGEEKVLLLIGTASDSVWNFKEIIEYECFERKLDMNTVLKHFHFVDHPQKMTDYDINIYYNVADIGINTCDGEGFGLCNFEQAAVGIPQIVPNIGTFPEFFNTDNSILLEPVDFVYLEHSVYPLCGKSYICDYKDVSEAIYRYYKSPELRQDHGLAAREYIVKKYKWSHLARKLYDAIIDITTEK
jgi:glycosyltransferase involved in cell wall biosynthesis